MHSHQLLDHPLFEEVRIDQVLEPFGFEVHTEILEPPCPHQDPVGFEAFEKTPSAYIDGLEFELPQGFTEIARFDNEDSEIVMVAVKPTNYFAQHILRGDVHFTRLADTHQAERLTVDGIMDQATNFSNTCQLVGGPFDRAEKERDQLRYLVEAVVAQRDRLAAENAAIRALSPSGYQTKEDLSAALLRHLGKGPDLLAARDLLQQATALEDMRDSMRRAGREFLTEEELEAIAGNLRRAATKLSGGEIPVGASDVGGAA